MREPATPEKCRENACRLNDAAVTLRPAGKTAPDFKGAINATEKGYHLPCALKPFDVGALCELVIGVCPGALGGVHRRRMPLWSV